MAAGVQLFGLHQRGRGQQNSRRCSAGRAAAAAAAKSTVSDDKIHRERRQNPPPPQVFGCSGSSSEGEGSKTAADAQLFGLHQRGRGQQNSRRCSAVRAPAARAETLKNANGKILFSQLGKLCRVRLSWLLFPVDGSI